MNVMSVALPGDSIRRSFFVTFVPIVVMYSSENLSTTKRRIRLVLPTAPSPRSKIFRLTWSSTMATPLHAGATHITLAGSMSAMRIRTSVRMKPEPRTDEARCNQIRLREERHVPVPLREDVRMGPFEFPYRDLEFPRQAVQVPPDDHRGEDRVLAAEHEDLALTESKLLERPTPVVERVADELLEHDQHPAHDVAVMDHALRAGPVADQHAAVVHQVELLETRTSRHVHAEAEHPRGTEAGGRRPGGVHGRRRSDVLEGEGQGPINRPGVLIEVVRVRQRERDCGEDGTRGLRRLRRVGEERPVSDLVEGDLMVGTARLLLIGEFGTEDRRDADRRSHRIAIAQIVWIRRI